MPSIAANVYSLHNAGNKPRPRTNACTPQHKSQYTNWSLFVQYCLIKKLYKYYVGCVRVASPRGRCITTWSCTCYRLFRVPLFSDFRKTLSSVHKDRERHVQLYSISRYNLLALHHTAILPATDTTLHTYVYTITQMVPAVSMHPDNSTTQPSEGLRGSLIFTKPSFLS